MDELIISFKKLLNQFILLSYRFYNKFCFIFNKQRTLQKMYAPLTDNKNKINEKLSLKLDALKNENNLMIKNSEKLIKESTILKNKISIMQELLLKK
jgi:hypothetical protein